jgi:hypothetical protein
MHEDDMDDWKVVQDGVVQGEEEHGEKKERPYSSRSAIQQRVRDDAANPVPIKPPALPTVKRGVRFCDVTEQYCDVTQQYCEMTQQYCEMTQQYCMTSLKNSFPEKFPRGQK